MDIFHNLLGKGKNNRRDIETAEAWGNKGVSLAHGGKYKEAVACYDRALALNARLAEA